MAHGWMEPAPEGPISRRLRLINAPEVARCVVCGHGVLAGDGFAACVRALSAGECAAVRLCDVCGQDLFGLLYGRTER